MSVRYLTRNCTPSGNVEGFATTYNLLDRKFFLNHFSKIDDISVHTTAILLSPAHAVANFSNNFKIGENFQQTY